MKKLLFALLSAPMLAFAAGPALHLDKAPDHSRDFPALQNGAKVFVNYCLNCHSASYMRYNRLQDIGLTEAQIKDNLMFTAEKVGMPMSTAMSAREGKEWFGSAPPDLSVVARARGADWLYTYLRTFYRDSASPTGWNNALFPNVAMPNVLWRLQGERVLKQEPAMRDGKPVSDGHGGTVMVSKFETLVPGTMTPLQYDETIRDLVAFMVWMGEPNQLQRKQLGVWVLFALTILVFMTYFLYKSYWKNVH